MKINVTKTGLENLVLQVVADNDGLALASTQVTAAAPAVIDEGALNTSVLLTAVEGQGFAGTKTVKYTRLGMDSGVAVPVSTLEVQPAAEQAAIEAGVVVALGLVAADVVFSAYTAAAEGAPGSITVGPAPDSLLYVGEVKAVTLTLPVVATPTLEDEIVVDELSGFTPA